MKRKFNKKIFLFLTLLLLKNVYAKTYNVELITNENQIDNGSLYSYILTANSKEEDYAWINGVNDISAKTLTQIQNNAVNIEINDNTITIDDSYAQAALWSFAISKNTVSYNKDSYNLVASYPFNDEKLDNIQLDFTPKDNSTNPTGFIYTINSYPIELKFNELANTKIKQIAGETNYWVQFSTTTKNFYVSETENSSKSFKIYKVIEKETPIQKYTNNQKETINFAKTQKKHESFDKTGVYQIDLSLNTQTILKNTDLLFVLDYSNSMNFETKKKQLDEMTKKLSSEFLNLNSNNRIGIIKFARSTIYKEESFSLGLSNDQNKINELIDKSLSEVAGGTNYTDALNSASKILKDNYIPNRDQIIIFISDGAPTIYNKTKYSSYGDTDDGIPQNYANNWYEYLSKYDLMPANLLKEKGVEIISIGVGTDQDMAISSDGSSVVKPEWVQNILTRISSGKAYFVENEEKINDIFNDLSFLTLFIKNMNVTDKINDDYHLVIEDFENYSPYVEIKLENGDVIERITFDENETKAYSSLLENENILTTNNNDKILNAKNFIYNFNTKQITWKIDRLSEENIILTYFIKKEGNDYLNYDSTASNGVVDVTYEDYNDNVQKLSFVTKNEKTNENIIIEEENIENPPTGQILPYLLLSLILIVGIISINYSEKRKLFKKGLK